MKTPTEHNHAFAQTCPLLLKDQQLENSYLVIEEFFSSFSLGYYRKELDIWFNAALHEQLKHPQPENLIYLHQQFQTLFNACYLIATAPHKSQPNLLKGKNTLYDQLLQKGGASDPESRAAEGYARPYWLTLNQRADPISFFQDTFTLENLKQLRLGLQEWVEDGLSEHSCLADTDPAYSFALYQQLHQTLEASYLLIAQPQS